MKLFVALLTLSASYLNAATCILWQPVIGEDRCIANEIISPLHSSDAGYTQFSMGTGADSAEFEITDTNKLTVKNNNILTAGNTYTAYVRVSNGTTGTTHLLSIEVLSGKVVPQISAGLTNTTILDRDGALFSAGDNTYGQIGDNTTTNRTTFTSISISGKTISQIDASRRGMAFLCTDGTVYATGQNNSGQLGLNNGDSDVSLPTQVTTGVGSKWVVQVSAGLEDIHFLTSDAQVYGAGLNTYGSVGNNTQTKQSAPIQMNTFGSLSGKTVVKISGGNQIAVFLTYDGEAHVCGRNVAGGLGINDATDTAYLVPTLVTNTGSGSGGDLGGNIKEIGGKNGRNIQVLTQAGKVFSSGENNYGQIGIGSTTDQTTLQQMTSYTGENYLQLGANDETTVLMTATDVYAVGRNFNESIVDSATASYTSLQLIPSADINSETPVAVEFGKHALYIMTHTGKLFVRGENVEGQLGLNNTTNPLAMTEVTGVDFAPGAGDLTFVDATPTMESTSVFSSTFSITWTTYEHSTFENDEYAGYTLL